MKTSEKLLKKINEKRAEIQNALEASDLEKAEEGKKVLDDLQKSYNLALEIEADDVNNIEPKEPENLTPIPKGNAEDSTVEFANAVRTGFQNMMSEGTKANGGYTVPEDIRTKIERYRDAEFGMRKLVSVENVTTQSGSRTFLKRRKRKGLTETAEAAAAKELAALEFERQDFEIKKYAGFIPVTDELLEDSDANITETISREIGEEARVTDNIKIFAAMDAAKSDVKEIKSYGDLSKIVIETLGSTFANTSTLVVNDTGASWLYGLTDNNGRPLIGADLNDPAKKVAVFGPYRVAVEVVPNSDLSNAVDGASPVYVGDFKEGFKIFDRQQITIKRSDTASIGNVNAFAEDLQIFKPTLRADYKVRDVEAYVRCKITAEVLQTIGTQATGTQAAQKAVVEAPEAEE